VLDQQEEGKFIFSSTWDIFRGDGIMCDLGAVPLLWDPTSAVLKARGVEKGEGGREGQGEGKENPAGISLQVSGKGGDRGRAEGGPETTRRRNKRATLQTAPALADFESLFQIFSSEGVLLHEDTFFEQAVYLMLINAEVPYYGRSYFSILDTTPRTRVLKFSEWRDAFGNILVRNSPSP
jgi:hypothetical protein